MPHGPQAKIRQVVAGIAPVLVETTDAEVREAIVAAEVIGQLTRLKPRNVRGLDVELLNRLHRALGRQHAGRDVGFVEGIHVLVEAPVGDAWTGALDVEQHERHPDGLDGLSEVACRAPWDLVHDGRNLGKLRLAALVCLNRS